MKVENEKLLEQTLEQLKNAQVDIEGAYDTIYQIIRSEKKEALQKAMQSLTNQINWI